METNNNTVKITVEAIVNAPLDKVWEFWTTPEHIIAWNFASVDWHTTKAENDLRVGGSFMSRMEAKDGSFGFDFYGIYDEVVPGKTIAYTLGDNRKVIITFDVEANSTRVIETFEAEGENPVELQRGGWQAILDNFKKHVETN